MVLVLLPVEDVPVPEDEVLTVVEVAINVVLLNFVVGVYTVFAFVELPAGIVVAMMVVLYPTGCVLVVEMYLLVLMVGVQAPRILLTMSAGGVS